MYVEVAAATDYIKPDSSAMSPLELPVYFSEVDKLARWRLRLAPFQLTFNFVEGSRNLGADWLSRLDTDHDETIDKVALTINALRPVALTKGDLLAAAPDGDDLPWLEPSPGGGYRHRVTKLLYVAPGCRAAILHLLHGNVHSGHAGMNRCYKLARAALWWPHMRRDIEQHIARCAACKAHRPLRTLPTTGRLDRPGFGEVLSFDHLVLDRAGAEKSRVLVMVDHATRFMVAELSSPGTQRQAVRLFLTRWMSLFGCPAVILTDNTPFVELLPLKELGIAHHHCSAWYPQGNGINEASHRFLRHAVYTNHAAIASNYSESEILAAAVLAYNSTPHHSLGCSPVCAVTGQEPVIPGWCAHEPAEFEERRRNQYSALVFRLTALALQEATAALTPVTDTTVLRAGDIVTYSLNPVEKRIYEHRSGLKGTPENAPPHRVIEIHGTTARLECLWGSPPGQVVRPIATLAKFEHCPHEEAREIGALLYQCRAKRTRASISDLGDDGLSKRKSGDGPGIDLLD